MSGPDHVVSLSSEPRVTLTQAIRHKLSKVWRGDTTSPARADVLAVHRAIVVVDVEGFCNRERTNAHQLTVRRSLYEILGQAFGNAGVPWAECDREDRGDGVLVLVPPTFSKTNLVASLPTELVAALRRHNRRHCAEEQIRLRMSVHAGEIHYDEHGVVGRAVNHAFRLLDARVLREALAGSADPLAIIASSWFFDEVIWHSDTANPRAYQEVQVRSKETDVTAWIHLPDSDIAAQGRRTERMGITHP